MSLSRLSSGSGHESNVSNSSVEHNPDSSFGSASGATTSSFAHLWSYDGRKPDQFSTIVEEDDMAANGASGGAAAANVCNGSPTQGAFGPIGPRPIGLEGVEGFGRLSIGEPLSTMNYPQHQPYMFGSLGVPYAGAYRGPPHFNHDGFGQLHGGVDMSHPFRSTAGHMQFGFDASSIAPPSYPMPARDFENRMPLSPESSRGSDFMSRLASLDAYGRSNKPHSLAVSRTVEQLKMLQELQDCTNPSGGGDLFLQRQVNEINSLISTLQGHLFTQYSQTKQNNSSPTSSSPSYNHSRTDDYLQRAALCHRERAQVSFEYLKWTGILPPKRNYGEPFYSTKVFLGGLPWEVTENCLVNTFKPFGKVRIEWPGKDRNRPKGYAYVLFNTERQVKNLIQNCTHDYSNGAYYISLSSTYVNIKVIQVIPWSVGDSNFVRCGRCPDTKLDPQKTIFVGALHGKLNAEGLSHIMQELFGGVVYAGIDTDRNQYPIGSGRVTFDNNMSYLKAVTAAFIEIRTSEFTKKIQVDPYLEDATCCVCKVQQGPYFCRDVGCFDYFCSSCFQSFHMDSRYRGHRPLMRNANKSGNPNTIMPTNFRARSSLTEISHSNGNGLLSRCGEQPQPQPPQWEQRFYE